MHTDVVHEDACVIDVHVHTGAGSREPSTERVLDCGAGLLGLVTYEGGRQALQGVGHSAEEAGGRRGLPGLPVLL